MRGTPLLLTWALLASVDTFAQQTPWGDPDLQGVWSNLTAILRSSGPLHGPTSHSSHRLKRPRPSSALASTLKNVEAQIATSGEFNEIWLESGKGRVPRNLSTSLVIDPPDGKIPYTREGRARWEETPHVTTERITGRTLRADTWEDRALQERCITSDTMFYANGFYNNYMQIVQAPGSVVIRVESMHDTRVIPLDGRPPLSANIKQWTATHAAGGKARRSLSGRRTSTAAGVSRCHRRSQACRTLHPRRQRHHRLPADCF